jgi:acyl-CoA dehydrogenase
MINFELDQEQKMLTDAIGRFAEERVRKVFRDADEEGKLPLDVVQAGWEMGVLPTSIPEAYGGFGEYSVVTGVLAAKRLPMATWRPRCTLWRPIWWLCR